MASKSTCAQRPVLLFTHRLHGGGAERSTVRVANILAQRHLPVCLLTLEDRHPDDLPLHPRVRRLALNLNSKQGRGILLPFYRLWRLWRLLCRERPRLVIGMMMVNGLMLLLLPKPWACPVIVYESNNPQQACFNRFWRLTQRILLRRAAAVVTQTHGGGHALTQLAGDVRICVIPNAVQALPAPTPPTLPEGLPADAPVILGVGRLVPAKGFDRLVAAFDRVAVANPDWHLVLVGDGPEAKRLQQQIQTTEAADRIHIVPFTHNIAAWYSHAQLLVSSSRYEGMPNVVLEAMALGLPVIAVDYAFGARDILGDSQWGLLVSKEPVCEHLANTLSTAIANPYLRRRLADLGRRRAAMFNPQRHGARWFGLVRKLLHQA